MREANATSGRAEIGTILGGTYEIVRQIGAGGMGEVYEARHARLAGRYAVKLLRHEVGELGSLAFQRFQREAEISSSLQHPNIVQVIDFNQTDDGTPYLVMELLEGCDLATRLAERGSLSVSEVLSVVQQVASALAAAHGRGVVHRDLKPQNVFLVPVVGQGTELVKVLDFGISKVKTASSLTGEAFLVGTPAYMSPEQARGARDEIDGSTDQFALAAMTYEMLTGRPPFGGDDAAAMLYRIVHEAPAPFGDIGWAALEAPVRKGLSKARADRFATITEFARALAEAAGDAPVATQRAPSAAQAATIVKGKPVTLGSPPPAPSLAPGPPVPGASPFRDRRPHRRAIAVGAGGLVAVAGFALWRAGRQGGGHRAGEAQARAQRERVQTAFRERAAALVTRARAAVRVPQLGNVLRCCMDDPATLREALAEEDWWRPYRAFPAALFDADRLVVARPADDGVLAQLGAEQKRTGLHGNGDRRSDEAGAMTFVVSGPARAYLAALVPTGVDRFSLALAEVLDTAALDGLAARAAAALLVSDGRRMLAKNAAAPDALANRLVGHEAEGLIRDEATGALAVVVSVGPGHWLWSIAPEARP